MSSTEHDSRPTGAKRKRVSQEASLHEDIAWTAARCNRLLRTINSRINAIRKLVRIDAVSDPPRKHTNSRLSEHWSTTDPIWLPTGTKKLKGRTYAVKKKPESKKASARREENSASLSFPSPFVRRIGMFDGSFITESPVRTKDSSPPKARCSRQLPIKASTELEEAEKGLTTALTSLIDQTKLERPERRTGARSLMSTCLRSVPAYIGLEIEIAAEQGEVESITSDVLTYLEEFGSRNGRGWEPLREIVRSQAITSICNAVRDGLIRDDLAESLAAICCVREAPSEGQHIFRSFLCSASKPAGDLAARLDHFCAKHHFREFRYETLYALGERDAAVLAEPFGIPLFPNNLLKDLAVSPSTAAWKYVGQVLCAFRDLEGSVSWKPRCSFILKGIVARIAAMACTGSLLGEAVDRSPALFEALICLAGEVLIATTLDPMQRLSSNSAQLMLCSDFLLGLESCSREHASVVTSASLSNILAAWSARASRRAEWRFWQQETVAELADALSTLETHLNIGLVEKLLDRVLEVSTAKSAGAKFLQEVSFAIISRSGEGSDAMDECASAEFLQQLASINAGLATPRTPFRDSLNKKFRWEQGLSEWVLATPFLGSTAICAAQASESADEEAADLADPLADSGYHSPRVILAGSPDVLAISPPSGMQHETRYSPMAKKRARRPLRFECQVAHPRHQKSRRISEEEHDLSSEDELGF